MCQALQLKVSKKFCSLALLFQFNHYAIFFVNQDTPLLMAAEKGHIGVVKYLYKKQADVNIRNKWQVGIQD